MAASPALSLEPERSHTTVPRIPKGDKGRETERNCRGLGSRKAPISPGDFPGVETDMKVDGIELSIKRFGWAAEFVWRIGPRVSKASARLPLRRAPPAGPKRLKGKGRGNLSRLHGGPVFYSRSLLRLAAALKCLPGYPLIGVCVCVRLFLIFNKKVRHENVLSNNFRVCVRLRIVCLDRTYCSSISLLERARVQK